MLFAASRQARDPATCLLLLEESIDVNEPLILSALGSDQACELVAPREALWVTFITASERRERGRGTGRKV